MTELKDKSEMKKENPSHSFTEGHQLSEEEKKPFLNIETPDSKQGLYGRSYDPEFIKKVLLERPVDLVSKRFNGSSGDTVTLYEVSKLVDEIKFSAKAAAEKANARIAELENELLDALDLKSGKGPTALQLLKHRLAEAEQKRDELQSWKNAEIKIWGPVIDFCQDNSEELGIQPGASISRWVIKLLERIMVIQKK